jgi:hypothetical protein
MTEVNNPGERPYVSGLYVEPDADRNTVYTTGAHVQHVTDTGKFLFVRDPQLGEFTIGSDSTTADKFLYDIMTTPGMYRSLGVSQLCKDEASATIPNTAQLTRHWHTIAVAGIVDELAKRQGLTAEERVASHLEASVDDRAHMDFSHAVELFLQRWGGTENLHEKMWPEYAKHGGERDVVEKYGLKVDNRLRLEGVDVPPWVGDKAPDIDVDRLEYTIAELLLWFDHDGASPETRNFIRQICSLDNIAIDQEGHMAFKDKEVAAVFSKGYLLLATEHWNEPVNRIQLHLLTQAAQRIVLRRQLPWAEQVDKGEMRLPEWYLYGIDEDIVSALHENHGHTDPMLHAIHGALYPIATAERRRFARFKMHEYSNFLMDSQAADYPSEHLSPKRVEFGPSHPSVSIEMHESTEAERANAPKMPRLDTNSDGIRYDLFPLKNRFVDPRVVTGDGTKRLSELDGNFKSLLEQQQRLQTMRTVVELVFASSFRDQFVAGVKTNDCRFEELKANQAFTSDQKRLIIRLAAERAIANSEASGRLVRTRS